ncbi:MAG: hypothetical protein ACKO37_08925 [Vampirovibrionales bacterium]
MSPLKHTTKLSREWLLSLVGITLACLTLCPIVEAEVGSDCSFQGIPLYGKVKVVDSFPDIKVKQVDSFQDLSVEKVSSFPDSCGQWQFVDSFPDFTIQYVDSFPDVTVRFVDSFPGLP